MIPQGELNKAQLKQLKDTLGALEMPPGKRQRLLWRIAKHGVVVVAKKHARQQVNPDGRAWKPRKRAGKKPMLRKLPKLIAIHELPTQQAVRLYFKGGNYRNGNQPIKAGVVGAAHNDGMTTTVNKQQLNNKKKQNSALATSAQAKRLRALNYQIKKKGRYVKAPVSYIKSQLTHAQAGLIIRILRDKPIKTTWKIELPSRVFLGVNDQEFSEILARQLQGIKYGWNVKKQDIK